MHPVVTFQIAFIVDDQSGVSDRMNYVVPVFAFVFLDIPSHTQDMPTVSIIARFTIFR